MKLHEIKIGETVYTQLHNDVYVAFSSGQFMLGTIVEVVPKDSTKEVYRKFITSGYYTNLDVVLEAVPRVYASMKANKLGEYLEAYKTSVTALKQTIGELKDHLNGVSTNAA